MPQTLLWMLPKTAVLLRTLQLPLLWQPYRQQRITPTSCHRRTRQKCPRIYRWLIKRKFATNQGVQFGCIALNSEERVQVQKDQMSQKILLMLSKWNTVHNLLSLRGVLQQGRPNTEPATATAAAADKKRVIYYNTLIYLSRFIDLSLYCLQRY